MQDKVGGTCSTHGEGGERCLQNFGWDVRGEDLGVGRRITVIWTLGRYGSRGRTGFSWLRIEPNGKFL
jgi:hypothetical protein